MERKIKFKINGLGITDKQYNALPFGRQMEYAARIAEFKSAAKSVHISQKRKSHAAAWKEFKAFYQPDQWLTIYFDSPNYRDDSFEVYYTTPAVVS